MARDFAKIEYEDYTKEQLKDLYRDMVVIVNKRISDYNKSGKNRKSFEDISYEMMSKLGQGRGREEYVSMARSGMGVNRLKDRIRVLKEFFAYDRVSKDARQKIDKDRLNQFKGLRNEFKGLDEDDFTVIMEAFSTLSSSEMESLKYGYLIQTYMDHVKGSGVKLVDILDEVMGERYQKKNKKTGKMEWKRRKKFNGTAKELKDAIIGKIKDKLAKKAEESVTVTGKKKKKRK